MHTVVDTKYVLHILANSAFFRLLIGGVKSTVSGVFKDLKFKILAKLRQSTGQRQENFNFGPSLLKF